MTDESATAELGSVGTDDAASEAGTEPSAAPMLRIVSPSTTPEEVAAIVAVLSALGGGEAPSRRPRPQWNAPHRMVRRPVAHGPGGWRASSLP